MANDEPGNFTPERQEDLDKYAEVRRRADDRAELIAAAPPFLERGIIYLVALVLAITIFILYFGKTNVVVEVKGKILPEGNVISLQSRQGGVALQVFAHAGDHLPAGAPVVQIDVSEGGLDVAELKRKQAMNEAELTLQRETIERLDRVLSDPRAATPGGAAIAHSAYQALSALENAQVKLDSTLQEERLLPDRRQQVQQEYGVQQQRLALQEKVLVESRKSLAEEEQALGRKKEQLLAIRKLAENKLLSAAELNTEEERYRAAETAFSTDRQRVDQMDVDISNTRLRLSELQTKTQTLDNESRASNRLARVQYEQALVNVRQERASGLIQVRNLQSEIEHSREQIGLREQRLEMAVIKMPVEGTLAELKLRAAGEIVSAGAAIATVVPNGVPLMVEASIPDKDVGFVRQGIQARVKVDAFPFAQFGAARAIVSRVLPAFGGNAGFVVQLKLLDWKLTPPGGEYYLFPGLSVQVDLITREQRLLEALMKSDAAKPAAP
jgi:multidrug resistance efflux pump